MYRFYLYHSISIDVIGGSRISIFYHLNTSYSQWSLALSKMQRNCSTTVEVGASNRHCRLGKNTNNKGSRGGAAVVLPSLICFPRTSNLNKFDIFIYGHLYIEFYSWVPVNQGIMPCFILVFKHYHYPHTRTTAYRHVGTLYFQADKLQAICNFVGSML